MVLSVLQLALASLRCRSLCTALVGLAQGCQFRSHAVFPDSLWKFRRRKTGFWWRGKWRNSSCDQEVWGIPRSYNSQAPRECISGMPSLQQSHWLFVAKMHCTLNSLDLKAPERLWKVLSDWLSPWDICGLSLGRKARDYVVHPLLCTQSEHKIIRSQNWGH